MRCLVTAFLCQDQFATQKSADESAHSKNGLTNLPAKESDRYIGRPSVCRNCGALIPSGERVCAQCGTALDTSATTRETRQPSYDRETMSFARAILGRPATFTIIFLVANVLLFLMVSLAGGSSNPATLVGYGAKLNSLINERGEWWRFVTPIFLHGGFLHLLFNMYGLWVIGPYVEKLYGSAKFVAFWVITGIAGVVASYLSVRPDMHVSSVGRFLFKATDSPSIGASGALFGLVGVLFIFGIRFRHELPEGFKRAFGTGMVPIILLNLFVGFLGRGFIDNAAHLGGLVSGAVLALVVGYKRPGPRGSVTIIWHILQASALALVLISFFMAWRSYDGPPLQLTVASLQRVATGGAPDINGYIRGVNDGSKVLAKYLEDGDITGIDRAVTTINSAPSFDKQADALLGELSTLLERAKRLNVKPGQNALSDPQNEQLRSDFNAWQQKNGQWAETKGSIYGIVRIESSPSKQSPAKK